MRSVSSVSSRKAAVRSHPRFAMLDGWPSQIGVPITRMSAARMRARSFGQASPLPSLDFTPGLMLRSATRTGGGHGESILPPTRSGLSRSRNLLPGNFRAGHRVDSRGARFPTEDHMQAENMEDRPGRHDASGRPVVATKQPRQGVTGHNVRYVLIFGLIAVVVGFALGYLGVSEFWSH